jgi:hypothetical protein
VASIGENVAMAAATVKYRRSWKISKKMAAAKMAGGSRRNLIASYRLKAVSRRRDRRKRTEAEEKYQQINRAKYCVWRMKK